MIVSHLPSSRQLKDFPETVKGSVTSIAFTVLQRLLYPILVVYASRKCRQKVINKMIEQISQSEIEAKLSNAIKNVSVLSTCIDPSELTDDISEKISTAIQEAMKFVSYRLFVQQEIIQYTREPSKAVAVILSGTGKRVEKLKTRHRSFSVQRNSFHSTSGQQPDSDQQSHTSSAHGMVGQSSISGSSAALKSKEKLIYAPSVFGELSAVGGYSCPDVVVAESSLALVAYMPKEAFCDILSVFPPHAQRRMMHKALSFREAQLSRHSPMTCERMRICPLLTHLSDKDLMHLIDYLVPRVYSAGTRIGETGGLTHIYFIRRGVVYLQQDESFLDTQSTPTQPMSRSLLVEGHTFGERQCIFREALGDAFYTVTHVDMYLLPFSVLIQFMKQQPDARISIYQAAKTVSHLLEREYEGMRFYPSSHETIPTVLLSTAGSVHITKWFHRRVSISSARPFVSEAPFSDGAPDEVEEPRKSGVSPQFVEKIRRIPLLSVCLPDDRFYEECAKLWKFYTYEPGSQIVRHGEECNRLLLFNEEGAVVVTDERSMSPEKKSLSSQCANFPRIPAGYIIGYTCVWRHNWAHSILVLDNPIEVWELNRQAFVELLRRHHLQSLMQTVALQVLQPLVHQSDRSVVLDYQPLLAPSPNSLWSEQRIPNMHPVSFCETVRYEVWKEKHSAGESVHHKKRLSRRVSGTFN